MNAVNSEMLLAARAPVAAPHATHTFRLLLRREFWEHRGGFLRAPLVAGAIFLLLTIMGLGIGEMAAKRLAHNTTSGATTTSHGININGSNVAINGLNLGKLTKDMGPDDMRQLGGVVDVSLYGAAIWPFIALAFVVFFYCLGSLYDDRKDRSVLFWKSLPVSDAQTVWSKVASATLVAPALAVIAAVATVIGFLILSSIVVMFHGGNPITLLWGPGSPLTVMGHLIASVPVYAIWALPTVGWLMLCSAWAPSKPFLWAVMIPVFAGIFVSWFDLMQLFNT
ncbi:MAG: ABC-2 transporter permease, partial [Dokdonella sp.]